MRRQSTKKQRGAVTVISALMMVFLLGIAALAIDVANALVTRNELQNAADAAALAAATCLYPRAVCGNPNANAPDWDTAQQRARDVVGMNKAQGVKIVVGGASSGYWNITSDPVGLESPPVTTGPSHLPAVRVSITKSDSNDNGSVKMFLASVIGVHKLDVSAAATAAISYPGIVGPGGLFPMAVSSCLFGKYWQNGSPLIAQDNKPLPGATITKKNGQQTPDTTPQTPGQPYVFKIGTSYQYSGCDAGQWTTFNTTNNSTDFERGVVDGKDMDQGTVSIGQNPGTYIQPGEENALFKYVQNCSAAGSKTCEWAIVPIVDSLTPKTYPVVVAYACVHILNASNGNEPYVLVQMAMNKDADHCQVKNAGGAGVGYGALQPPRLVQ